MTPGRELDALIAEKVMGDKLQYPVAKIINSCDKLIVDGNSYINLDPKPYSTDIVSAWNVRNRVRQWRFSERRVFLIFLQELISSRLEISKGSLIHTNEIVLNVEPIDICLAALKALDPSK